MLSFIQWQGHYPFEISDFKLDWKVITGLINIAWPATFQFILTSGSWIVLTRLVAETGSTTASAGYQIAIRNVVFFILPAWGLSNAAATLVGQNLGANQPMRAEQSVLLTAKYNAWFMSFVTLLFVIFPEPIIRIFTQEDPVVLVGNAGTPDYWYWIYILWHRYGDDAGIEWSRRYQDTNMDQCIWILVFSNSTSLYSCKSDAYGPNGCIYSDSGRRGLLLH
jgi:Na+-driven multidrug efflux pump